MKKYVFALVTPLIIAWSANAQPISQSSFDVISAAPNDVVSDQAKIDQAVEQLRKSVQSLQETVRNLQARLAKQESAPAVVQAVQAPIRPPVITETRTFRALPPPVVTETLSRPPGPPPPGVGWTWHPQQRVWSRRSPSKTLPQKRTYSRTYTVLPPTRPWAQSRVIIRTVPRQTRPITNPFRVIPRSAPRSGCGCPG